MPSRAIHETRIAAIHSDIIMGGKKKIRIWRRKDFWIIELSYSKNEKFNEEEKNASDELEMFWLLTRTPRSF